MLEIFVDWEAMGWKWASVDGGAAGVGMTFARQYLCKHCDDENCLAKHEP